MATETKRYKPGQFVWIKGKKYRVTKGKIGYYVGICCQCQFSPYSGCLISKWCQQRLPINCYPKPI